MTMTTISDLLARKREIDQLGDGQEQFTRRFRWLQDAVEHLLRIELERREPSSVENLLT
jgi:hypothetical protein